jgi:polar amino acid transport system permease protein
MRHIKRFLGRVPGWIIILVVVTVFVLESLLGSDKFLNTLQLLRSGLLVTVELSLISFAISLIIGIVVGLGRASRNPVISFPLGLYVEVFRAIPLFVVFIYFSYVITPTVAAWLGVKNINEFTRAIIALGIAEGAYIAEDIRAGIESIGVGQMEASKSIGMSFFQSMRFVILPQAIRNVMPTLGNDFIGLVKDSSIASLIAVEELTHLGRVNVALTFDTFTTWNAVTLLYVVMTLGLAAGLSILEERTKIH